MKIIAFDEQVTVFMVYWQNKLKVTHLTHYGRGHDILSIKHLFLHSGLTISDFYWTIVKAGYSSFMAFSITPVIQNT